MARTSAPRALGVVGVTALLIVGIASAQGPVRGGTLRVATAADHTTLDPHFATMANELNIFHAVLNTLVGVDDRLHVVPELAESWRWEGETTLALALRKGVKFHDGTDFDAAAVKFNLDRLMDPATKSRLASQVDEIKTVEVVEPHLVRFRLKYPSAGLLATLSHVPGMMMSPTAVKRLGKDIARAPVGTGPFRFVEWVRDDHLTVERFEGYWDRGKPYVDRVVFKPIPDTNVAVIALKTGTTDIVTTVEPKDVAGLKGRRDVVYTESPGLNYYMIRLNLSQPPFDNRAVRLALAHAIDRESIAKGLFFGAVRVATGPITAASWAYSPEIKGYGRDVAKARALLAEAGKPSVKFEMQSLPSPIVRRLGEAVKAQAADIGLDITLAPLEAAKMMQNSLAMNYQAMLSYRSGREDPDGSTYRDFHTTGAFNRMKYSNPKMDDLLLKARSTFVPEERKALYAQVQRLVLEDSPVIFIVEMPTGQAVSARVKNFVHYPNMYVKLAGVWLER